MSSEFKKLLLGCDTPAPPISVGFVVLPSEFEDVAKSVNPWVPPKVL